jgi:hypothetical protein
MRLSQGLEEAIFTLSDDELLSVLSEEVIHDMRVGDFSPETVEEAFVGILFSYGLSEEDIDIVYEAIDEFGESAGLTEGFMDWLKAAGKKALKAAGQAAIDAAKEGGKVAIATSAKELQKRIKDKEKKEPADGTEPEKKKKSKSSKKKSEPEPKDNDDDDEPDLKQDLKKIAGKALGKIADDPGKAKEILKKHGKKAARAVVKHGVKKGMKMVFGRWVKSKGDSKKEALEWLVSKSKFYCLEEGINVYDYEGEAPDWVVEAFGAETQERVGSQKYEFVPGDVVRFSMTDRG